MKRHASLVTLSRDHHAALVLAKRIADCAEDAAQLRALCETVALRFRTELQPHFEDEEQRILPRLAGCHDAQWQQTLSDHANLRALAARIAEGDAIALRQFGIALNAHVRFEERELFPLYEALIPQG
ncbi:MAG TPA: hemerythrin domain-containing protein [Rhodocyclaceae bacterium]|nr:hemerythrin domain-containing protein [Rhodocyclaceae bacterium]